VKPVSIIFLVIAVLIAAAGFVTCLVAQNIAEADNIEIFTQSVDENNNTVFRYDFTQDDVNKIEALIGDANIHVYGNAETSYIELFNFNEGMYTFNVSGKIISIAETINLGSMLKFWDNGFNFKGLRHFFMFGKDPVGEKTVNIYLAAEHNVKIIKLQNEEGDIRMADISRQLDYDISCEKGTVTLENVKTTSTVTIAGEKCDVLMTGCLTRTVNVALESGDFTADSIILNDLVMKVETGDVSIGIARQLDYYGYDIKTESGNVRIDNGAAVKTYTLQPEDQERKLGDIKIEVEAGDISVYRYVASTQT